jgi:hypothetical protein
MTSQIECTSDESSSASEDLPGSATPASNLLWGLRQRILRQYLTLSALRGIDALQGLPNAYIYIRWVVPLIELPIQRGPFPLFLREQYGQVFQAVH